MVGKKFSLRVCFCLGGCLFFRVKTYLNVFAFSRFIFKSFPSLLCGVQGSIRLYWLILPNFARLLENNKILKSFSLIFPTFNILRFQSIMLFNIFLGAAGQCFSIEINRPGKYIQLIHYGFEVLFLNISFLLPYIEFEFLCLLAGGKLLLFDFVNCFFITWLHLTIIIILNYKH